MNLARTAASLLTVVILGILTPVTAFPQSADPVAPTDVPAAERAALVGVLQRDRRIGLEKADRLVWHRVAVFLVWGVL